MWFKQYMIEELDGTVYILWLAESGSYYQSTLGHRLEDYEQHVKIN